MSKTKPTESPQSTPKPPPKRKVDEDPQNPRDRDPEEEGSAAKIPPP